MSAQTNGVWNDTASGGLWSGATNWQASQIANGTGATADFSQLILPANNTIHLDSRAEPSAT